MPDKIPVSESVASLPDPMTAPKSYYHNTKERPWSQRRIPVWQTIVAMDAEIIGMPALWREFGGDPSLIYEMAARNAGSSIEAGFRFAGTSWGRLELGLFPPDQLPPCTSRAQLSFHGLKIGDGRDDGVNAGEFSPIFYRKCALFSSLSLLLLSYLTPSRIIGNRSSVELIKWDSFWPSKTPFTPSKYHDAGCFRIVTVAQFKSHSNGAIFTVINTHLDHVSDAQRRYGASLLLVRSRYEAYTTGRPVFVMGDFNRSVGRSSWHFSSH
jgi:hypothetical protein